MLEIKPPELIRSERLILVKTHPKHSQKTFEIIQRQQRQLSEFLSWADRIQTIEDQNNFVSKAQSDWEQFKAFHFQIFHSEILVGAISIHTINFEEKTFQLGYWVEEQSKGKGYISESIQTLNQIMGHRGWEKTQLKIRNDNVLSLRIAEKLNYIKMPQIGLSNSEYNLYSKNLDSK